MSLIKTKYRHKIDDGRIQCDVCPRFCKLHDGQRGLCFVRARENEDIVLTTWGRSSGFCLDPIEKKPLNHFLPGTPVLSFGTAGCNLACKFCQNHDITKSREFDRLTSKARPDMIAEVAQKTGARSVAFTYNDPVIFLEYAIDVARECRKRQIKTVAVTAGYICPEPRKEFFSYIDAANVDLKGFTEKFYKRLCAGQLEPVLDTLKYIKHETGVWLEITTLLIPGENDSRDEIEAMSIWIREHLGSDVPLHFSAFHPDWKMTDTPHTSHASLSKAREIARRSGIKYVYLGNVHDKMASSTYCPSCADLLIGRDWYQLSDWKIRQGGNYEGRCASCSEHIAGVFEVNPGKWGRKRQPVRFKGV